MKFLKEIVFQAYGLKNIKLVASERSSSKFKNDSSFRANKF